MTTTTWFCSSGERQLPAERDVHWAPAMTLQHDGIDLEDVWQAIEVCYEKSWSAPSRPPIFR